MSDQTLNRSETQTRELMRDIDEYFAAMDDYYATLDEQTSAS